MVKNLIQLEGEALDIEDMKISLKSGEWAINQTVNGYFLESKHLNGLTDSTEIMAKAKDFLNVLNGALNVVYSNHWNVQTGNLTMVNEDGTKNTFIFIDSAIEVRSRTVGTLTTAGNNQSTGILTTVEKWIKKADKNESVRDAIHFFNDITWWNLYKVFEIIRDNVGGKKKLAKFMKLSDINLFTHNADNRQAIGDLARHATMKNKPPKKILALNDAHKIIRTLFQNWIETKN